MLSGHINHDNYKSWEYVDSHLTKLGWRQAENLGRRMGLWRVGPHRLAWGPVPLGSYDISHVALRPVPLIRLTVRMYDVHVESGDG